MRKTENHGSGGRRRPLPSHEESSIFAPSRRPWSHIGSEFRALGEDPMRRLVLLTVMLAAVHAMPASAQLEQGRLTGSVSDAQGALLPAVTVTATSPSLIGNEVAVTEAEGKYLFPALPSGTYTLTFVLPGFKQ